MYVYSRATCVHARTRPSEGAPPRPTREITRRKFLENSRKIKLFYQTFFGMVSRCDEEEKNVGERSSNRRRAPVRRLQRNGRRRRIAIDRVARREREHVSYSPGQGGHPRCASSLGLLFVRRSRFVTVLFGRERSSSSLPLVADVKPLHGSP